MHSPQLPAALESLPEIEATLGGRTPAFFVDFDGTLAPLVDRPEAARMPPETGAILASLAEHHLVCVVSGRALSYLRGAVGLDSLYYAADHGHSISGPAGSEVELRLGTEEQSAVEVVTSELQDRLMGIEGVVVEPKPVSVAVHYRLVAPEERLRVRTLVTGLASAFENLGLLEGKYVLEVIPGLTWGKGQAVLWLLEESGLSLPDTCPICVGDDLTDEDMFTAVGSQGITVLVGEPSRPTAAGYRLQDPDEVARFLAAFLPPHGHGPRTLV